MADITRRRKGELLRKLFEILMAQPDGMRARDALAALESKVQLTEYESGHYSRGARRFEWIVRFTSVDTVKAGWLTKAKGIWTVTDAGREAHRTLTDPDKFYGEAGRLYRAWRSSQPARAEGEENIPEDGVTATSVEGREVALTYEEAEEQAWQEVQQYLAQMPPYDLQDLVAGLLKAMGNHIEWISPPGKDGGIDILAFSDPLGTKPPRIKVQVKRHGEKIRVDGLRAFLALLSDGDVGIFVNTGGFSRDAEDEARKQEKRRIVLVDAERLFDLWVEHYKSLEDKARSRMPVRPIWFLAPAE
jgi:restriction system protein